jgi:DNA replication and repair protein RecF
LAAGELIFVQTVRNKLKLTSLTLNNFRSYQKATFDFSGGTTLFIGPNTIGKTNILEAIMILSLGKSWRAQTTVDMIKYDQELARVTGLAANNTKLELEVMLTTGTVQGRKTSPKLFKINGVGKRRVDFSGKLLTVKFGPEDINLILGSPGRRRDWLDYVLEQVDIDYRRSNLSYTKGLRNRNRLLQLIRDGKANSYQLEFWNRLLVKNGEVITRKRQELIQDINQFWQNHKDKDWHKLLLTYDQSTITFHRLETYKDAEIASGITLIGPHRDDIKFSIFNEQLSITKDLSQFGSRGQQRMTVLALKMAELEYVTTKMGVRPLLLLDDIFSELDHEHRHEVLEVLGKQQTIMTTTDIHLVEKNFLDTIEVIKLGG